MNYLSAYFRFLMRNKTLTLINLAGLALGISSCIFITIFVVDELSYDSSNKNLDRIIRLTSKITSETSVDEMYITGGPVADELERSFPEVEKAVRLNVSGKEQTIKLGSKLFTQAGVYKADADIFSVFTYPMITGNPATALSEPNRVVLTRSLALKYYGRTDVLGEVLTIGKRDHLVNGVIEDIPSNSDLRFNMLTSMDTTDRSNDWFDFSYITYVLLNEKSVQSPGFIDSFTKKLNDLHEEKVNNPLKEMKANIVFEVKVQPLKGLHFQPKLFYDTPKGNKEYTYIFSCVAGLILLIACMNFINFSIVQSIERSKEVGIRKVIGASFRQLVVKYLSESFMFTLVSMLAGFCIVIALLPVFNDITGKSFGISNLWNVPLLGIMLCILVVVGVLAGSYPAFYTSSMRPVLALKGRVSTPKGALIRKISVSSQFFISIGLIICTGVVFSQMNFIKSYDLGFNRDNIIVVSVPVDSTLLPSVNAFREKVKQEAFVTGISISGVGAIPGDLPERGSTDMHKDGKVEHRMINYSTIDEHYIPLMGIRLLQGRNYDGSEHDRKNSIIINNALAKMMGWDEPLNQQLEWGTTRKVIGVVSDFHYTSLYSHVDPQLLALGTSRDMNGFIKISTSDLPAAIARLESIWSSSFSEDAFSYKFLDASVAHQYEKESKAMTVFSYFSGLTIIISFLGLFGLSSLTVYQRKKEIGIRRIVGANYKSIIVLFAREYMMLILIAAIAVSPLVWYAMETWLETFPYRESMPFVWFGISWLVVLVISFITVMFSLAKISSAQPVSLIRES